MMNEIYNEFIQYLTKQDKENCVKYILKCLDEKKVTIVELYEDILTKSLNSIGCEIDNEKVCIWKEHVRSSIIRTIIENCYKYVLLEVQNKINKKVFVMCPDGETHELGARIVADYFTMKGLDTVYVGSSTPKAEFIDVINYIKPDYIALSVTNYFNLVEAKKVINEIRNKDKKVKIIVGGNAFKNRDNINEFKADYLLNSYKDIDNILKEGLV